MRAGSKTISSGSKVEGMRAQAAPSRNVFATYTRRVRRTLHERKFIRYGLLSLNILLLVGVVYFVAKSAPSPTASHRSAALAGTKKDTAASDPLDQISSADIAVNLARATKLEETIAVTNQADSASTELSIPPATTFVASKPQVVVTELKSKKDIQEYVVLSGETVASIAAKFNVTSDSITASNGISGNQVDVGKRLVIPPVSGIVYAVKDGDTADSLAQKFSASKDQIIVFNDAEIVGLKIGERIIIPNGRQPVTAAAAATTLSYYKAAYGANGYVYGFCTWYVADMRNRIGRPIPSNLGDAWTWDDRASAAGLSVNTTPSAGSVIVTGSTRRPGHVAYVEKVNDDGSIWISEMNARGQRSMTDSTIVGGWGKVDYRLIPANQVRSYNYIH